MGETPIENYVSNNVPASYSSFNDAAIIVLSRFGFESQDHPKTVNADRDQKHGLALDKYERALIDHVTDNFDKVIVVLNTLNVIEAGELEDNDKIDSILWIGGPGSTGIMALGEILMGTVTPSGHTTDIWASDFTKDPTWNNFSVPVDASGNYKSSSSIYSGAGLSTQGFVRYQEDVYLGYRYYETRAYEERKGGDAANEWYDENVVYPFGYGLSYTSFDWEVTDKSSIDNVAITADGKYNITVKVTNTGAYKGKDVVQMYAKLHYNNGGLEKPYVVLCGYAKTPMLYPTSGNAANSADAANGSDKPNSATVTLTFTPYDIASYDCYGTSGVTGWVIEAGNDYELFINSDSNPENAEKIAIPFKVTSNLSYAKDPTTGNSVVNRFTGQTNEMFNSDLHVGTLMTRTGFVQPAMATAEQCAATSALANAIKDVEHNNTKASTYTVKPDQGMDATKQLYDLIKYDEATGSWVADYDEAGTDETWKAILDSYTVKEMADLVNMGGFGTAAKEEIKKPATLESDGPVGWCNFIATDDTWTHNVAYTSQVVVSATWNVDLAKEMGECVGEEALQGSIQDGRSYSGWYSPGVNLHRSPFGGRNFEYYSEDPFLTGKTAAALIQGCRSKGVYTYVKHFAANEQETFRSGGITWATERALRELYFKPFEFAVKEGKTTTVMSSFNRIGTRWTGGDYRLLTEILRDEWGFRGTVICDYNVGAVYMNVRQMVYAGGDLNLATDKKSSWTDYDKKSAQDVTVLRMATKNVLYTVANSNALNNKNYRYEPALWRIWLTVFNIAVPVLLVGWGVLVVVSVLRKKKKADE